MLFSAPWTLYLPTVQFGPHLKTEIFKLISHFCHAFSSVAQTAMKHDVSAGCIERSFGKKERAKYPTCLYNKPLLLPILSQQRPAIIKHWHSHAPSCGTLRIQYWNIRAISFSLKQTKKQNIFWACYIVFFSVCAFMFYLRISSCNDLWRHYDF